MPTDTPCGKTGQCYVCGRTIGKAYMVQRLEQRRATRYHGKMVSICIYCAEDWDNRFPDSELPLELKEAPPQKDVAVISPAPQETELPEEAPLPQQLTKRQAERLAWYEGNKPIKGYDVKSAILRDDALGAIAHQAETLGLSYGYLMVRREQQKR